MAALAVTIVSIAVISKFVWVREPGQRVAGEIVDIPSAKEVVPVSKDSIDPINTTEIKDNANALANDIKNSAQQKAIDLIKTGKAKSDEILEKNTEQLMDLLDNPKGLDELNELLNSYKH